jgi:hypothetical protein
VPSVIYKTEMRPTQSLWRINRKKLWLSITSYEPTSITPLSATNTKQPTIWTITTHKLKYGSSLRMWEGKSGLLPTYLSTPTYKLHLPPTTLLASYHHDDEAPKLICMKKLECISWHVRNATRGP